MKKILAGEVSYQMEATLKTDEFIDILERSGLAERRPVTDGNSINKMCANSNLVITGRISGRLIGIARSITDFGFCTYLSDLAVDKAYQNCGIGKKLINETKKIAPTATLILLSAPAATAYYKKIGMEKFGECFILRPSEKNKS